jgi:hypothetical protein
MSAVLYPLLGNEPNKQFKLRLNGCKRAGGVCQMVLMVYRDSFGSESSAALSSAAVILG